MILIEYDGGLRISTLTLAEQKMKFGLLALTLLFLAARLRFDRETMESIFEPTWSNKQDLGQHMIHTLTH